MASLTVHILFPYYLNVKYLHIRNKNLKFWSKEYRTSKEKPTFDFIEKLNPNIF